MVTQYSLDSHCIVQHVFIPLLSRLYAIDECHVCTYGLHSVSVLCNKWKNEGLPFNTNTVNEPASMLLGILAIVERKCVKWSSSGLLDTLS